MSRDRYLPASLLLDVVIGGGGNVVPEARGHLGGDSRPVSVRVRQRARSCDASTSCSNVLQDGTSRNKLPMTALLMLFCAYPAAVLLLLDMSGEFIILHFDC